MPTLVQVLGYDSDSDSDESCSALARSAVTSKPVTSHHSRSNRTSQRSKENSLRRPFLTGVPRTETDHRPAVSSYQHLQQIHQSPCRERINRVATLDHSMTRLHISPVRRDKQPPIKGSINRFAKHDESHFGDRGLLEVTTINEKSMLFGNESTIIMHDLSHPEMSHGRSQQPREDLDDSLLSRRQVLKKATAMSQIPNMSRSILTLERRLDDVESKLNSSESTVRSMQQSFALSSGVSSTTTTTTTISNPYRRNVSSQKKQAAAATTTAALSESKCSDRSRDGQSCHTSSSALKNASLRDLLGECTSSDEESDDDSTKLSASHRSNNNSSNDTMIGDTCVVLHASSNSRSMKHHPSFDANQRKPSSSLASAVKTTSNQSIVNPYKSKNSMEVARRVDDPTIATPTNLNVSSLRVAAADPYRRSQQFHGSKKVLDKSILSNQSSRIDKSSSTHTGQSSKSSRVSSLEDLLGDCSSGESDCDDNGVDKNGDDDANSRCTDEQNDTTMLDTSACLFSPDKSILVQCSRNISNQTRTTSGLAPAPKAELGRTSVNLNKSRSMIGIRYQSANNSAVTVQKYLSSSILPSSSPSPSHISKHRRHLLSKSKSISHPSLDRSSITRTEFSEKPKSSSLEDLLGDCSSDDDDDDSIEPSAKSPFPHTPQMSQNASSTSILDQSSSNTSSIASIRNPYTSRTQTCALPKVSTGDAAVDCSRSSCKTRNEDQVNAILNCKRTSTESILRTSSHFQNSESSHRRPSLATTVMRSEFKDKTAPKAISFLDLIGDSNSDDSCDMDTVVPLQKDRFMMEAPTNDNSIFLTSPNMSKDKYSFYNHNSSKRISSPHLSPVNKTTTSFHHFMMPSKRIPLSSNNLIATSKSSKIDFSRSIHNDAEENNAVQKSFVVPMARPGQNRWDTQEDDAISDHSSSNDNTSCNKLAQMAAASSTKSNTSSLKELLAELHSSCSDESTMMFPDNDHGDDESLIEKSMLLFSPEKVSPKPASHSASNQRKTCEKISEPHLRMQRQNDESIVHQSFVVPQPKPGVNRWETQDEESETNPQASPCQEPSLPSSHTATQSYSKSASKASSLEELLGDVDSSCSSDESTAVAPIGQGQYDKEMTIPEKSYLPSPTGKVSVSSNLEQQVRESCKIETLTHVGDATEFLSSRNADIKSSQTCDVQETDDVSMGDAGQGDEEHVQTGKVGSSPEESFSSIEIARGNDESFSLQEDEDIVCAGSQFTAEPISGFGMPNIQSDSTSWQTQDEKYAIVPDSNHLRSEYSYQTCAESYSKSKISSLEELLGDVDSSCDESTMTTSSPEKGVSQSKRTVAKNTATQSWNASAPPQRSYATPNRQSFQSISYQSSRYKSINSIKSSKGKVLSFSSSKLSNEFVSPARSSRRPQKRIAPMSGKRGTDVARIRCNSIDENEYAFDREGEKDIVPDLSDDRLTLESETNNKDFASAGNDVSPEFFPATQSPISPKCTYGTNDGDGDDEIKSFSDEESSDDIIVDIDEDDDDDDDDDLDEDYVVQKKVGKRLNRLSIDDPIASFGLTESYEDSAAGNQNKLSSGRKPFRQISENVGLQNRAVLHYNKLCIKKSKPMSSRTKTQRQKKAELVDFPDPIKAYSLRKRKKLETILSWIAAVKDRSLGLDQIGVTSGAILSLPLKQVMDLSIRLCSSCLSPTSLKINVASSKKELLPGNVLIVARSKDDLTKWESKFRESTGASVLNHATLTTIERRSFSTAKKCSLYDIILTTYDGIKSPDVAIAVDGAGRAVTEKQTQDGGWYTTRTASQGNEDSPKATKLLSILHKLQFKLIIFVDTLGRKSFLAKADTSRSSAAIALVSSSRFALFQKVDDGDAGVVELMKSHRRATESLATILHLPSTVGNDVLIDEHVFEVGLAEKKKKTRKGKGNEPPKNISIVHEH